MSRAEERVEAREGLRNSLGIHALVWASRWDTRQAERAVRLSAEAGYDLVEFPMLDTGAVNPIVARKAIEQTGLAVTCSLGLPFDADISSDDIGVVAAGERQLIRSLEAASDLGARLLTGVVYSALGKYDRPPSRTGWMHAAEALSRVGSRAKSLGMTVGLEVVNRYESNLINTAADALRMVRDIGLDNVIIHLDTYHMNIEEGSFTAPVILCGQRLGYVHVGESNRGFLGSGLVDFTSLLMALNQVGYAGPITFESFSAPSTLPELASTLAVWRPLWKDPMVLAVQARQYLTAMLTGARQGQALADSMGQRGSG